MIIRTTNAQGRSIRIEVDGKIRDYYEGYTCWGRLWINSKQRFSKVVMIHDFQSYEVETDAAKWATP
jgi:hypothetical protein